MQAPTDGKTLHTVASGPVASVEPQTWQSSRAPVVKVPVASLRAAESPRLCGESVEHIRALAEAEGRLPPIVVQRSTMRVIDGMHRLRAAQLCERDEIEVRFFDGDDLEAFILAVKANVTHGLPLSLADRKAAAARIIAANPQLSDRLIASEAGIAAKTVHAMRARAAEAVPPPGSRVGQDGRVRPVSSRQGRQIASELMADDPELSLRQVARAAGISPETARDVRRRLRRGEDPVSPKQRGWKRAAKEPGSETRQPSEVAKRAAEATGAPSPELLVLIRQLKDDPVLRVSEAGRVLLKILYAHTVINERIDVIVDGVPARSRNTLASAARECARVWGSFARRLELDVDVRRTA
jgi:ParB-like chromosome segregation protein Spo0J